MKLTIIFVLYAGFCLAKDLGSAVVNTTEDVEKFDNIGKDVAEDIKSTEPRNSGVHIVFKKALRTVKGLNCTIKEVSQLQTGAQKFKFQVEACGPGVSKTVDKIINVCQEINVTCEESLGINAKVCGNPKPLEVIENAKPNKICSSKMLKKLQTLKKQMRNGLKLIKQTKKSPKNSTCQMEAVLNLKTELSKFPDAMKNCSEPTDN